MNTALQGVLTPFQRFLRLEAAGGLLLLAITIIALIWANSPLGDDYVALMDRLKRKMDGAPKHLPEASPGASPSPT